MRANDEAAPAGTVHYSLHKPAPFQQFGARKFRQATGDAAQYFARRVRFEGLNFKHACGCRRGMPGYCHADLRQKQIVRARHTRLECAGQCFAR